MSENCRRLSPRFAAAVTAADLHAASAAMSTQIRRARSRCIAAVWVSALACALAMPTAASAASIGVFSFSLDVATGDPIVDLTNGSGISFSSFTITLKSLLSGPEGDASDIRDLALSESLDAGTSNQWLAGGFVIDPSLTFTPLSATLSAFIYGAPGAISYSFDAGATFVTTPTLDFSSQNTTLSIFFDPDTTAVPEPGTLASLAAGLAALGARRWGRSAVK